MERNNLKKITGSRWFLPVVCAVSFVFGWWYLSITTCAPLGGDDEIINLQNYYYITHTPWWQVDARQGNFEPAGPAKPPFPAVFLAAGPLSQ